MELNTLAWTLKAARQLRKLPHAAQAAIRDAVQAELPHFPACRGVKALTHHAYGYRLRVGRYRVLFDFDGAVRIISIQEVSKRNERTY